LSTKHDDYFASYYLCTGLSEEYGRIVVDNMLEHKSQTFIVRELRVYDQEKVL